MKTNSLKKLALLVALALPQLGIAVSSDSANISDGFVKIGVLNDRSGIYESFQGKGSVVAAELAIEDFGGSVIGKPIKLISANHHNDPARGSTTAREWIERDGVDMIADLGPSPIALAVQNLASDREIITFSLSGGTDELTGKQCSKYGIQYTYNTYSLAAGIVSPIVEAGNKSWYSINVDTAFGKTLNESTKSLLDRFGGTLTSTIFFPPGTTEYSTYLLRAKSSKADVIMLGDAGADVVNMIKQARQYRITDTQQLVAPMLFLTDIHAIGLEDAQGLLFAAAWYWDQDEPSRKWAARFYERHGKMPTYMQASMYSAVTTYLKAIESAGTDDASAVREELGKLKINDIFTSDGHIEPSGLMRHSMYLMRVKDPVSSTGPWDLLEPIATISKEDAFLPASENPCHLLH